MLRRRVEGLMAYGPNFAALYRHAAGYVDRLLRGAKSADQPIESPEPYASIFHRRTAETLGLTLPFFL